MAADDFTKRQFKWLDQVFADPAVTTTGFALAYCIAKFFNRETGDAWPSQATLAAEARLTVRSIRDLTSQLQGAGHLAIIGSRGRGVSCRYRPIYGQMHLPGIEPIKAPEPDREPESQETPAPKPAPRAKKKPSANRAALTADFEAWWSQYPPSKGRKEAARKPYCNARKSATADELLAGAMRYAAERMNEDKTYTLGAARWLNEKAWLDEPEPARMDNGFGGSHPTRARSSAPAQSWTEIALGGLKDGQFD